MAVFVVASIVITAVAPPNTFLRKGGAPTQQIDLLGAETELEPFEVYHRHAFRIEARSFEKAGKRMEKGRPFIFAWKSEDEADDEAIKEIRDWHYMLRFAIEQERMKHESEEEKKEEEEASKRERGISKEGGFLTENPLMNKTAAALLSAAPAAPPKAAAHSLSGSQGISERISGNAEGRCSDVRNWAAPRAGQRTV